MNSADDFGAWLKERRRALGLSQRALAQQLGVKASHVAFLEKGQRRPSLNLVTRLADRLGLDPQELLLRAHPEAQGLVKPAVRDLPRKTTPLWQRFVKDRALLTRYGVTMRELQALEHVSLLGTISSTQHLLAILMLIRDIPEKE